MATAMTKRGREREGGRGREGGIARERDRGGRGEGGRGGEGRKEREGVVGTRRKPACVRARLFPWAPHAPEIAQARAYLPY